MVDNGHTRSRLLRMIDRIVKKLSHELEMGGGTRTLFPQSRCDGAPKQFWEQLQVFSRGLRPFVQDSDVGIKPWGTVTISSASTQKTPHTLSCVLLEAVVALAFAYPRMTVGSPD